MTTITAGNGIEQPVTPDKIMQVGMGFWASKVLLTATKFELFTLLGNNRLSAREIKEELGLHERGEYDFLDALVALGFLQRDGFKESALYSNAVDTGMFLDKNKPFYLGGILEFSNDRLFRFWNDLGHGLQTGQAQSETKHGEKNIFEINYSSPEKLRLFIDCMTGIALPGLAAFAKAFDFSPYKTLCDIGGSGGHLSIQVALNNPHVRCTTLDLPSVEPIAGEIIESFGLSDRVKAVSGDFFAIEFPRADIITMSTILHDWNLEKKKGLIAKAFAALPEGGALVVIENLIDNDRRENAFGLLMSLNMLIEFGDGFDFTADDFTGWAKEAGFRQTAVIPLLGPTSAVVAFK